MMNSGFTSGALWRAEYDRNAWRKRLNGVIDVHKLIPAWQALQSAAPLAHIEKEADYEHARGLAE
jgi:hypothetical protein